MTEANVLINERRVDTPNGRVFVRDMPGADPPIVLMHGFPDDSRIYDRLVPLLAPRRVVTFDFLGYGRSDRLAAAEAFDPEGDLRLVIDALGLDHPTVVGHDASG